MIRIVASTSSKYAKSYFTEGLNRADYYTNDQEMPGQFGGKLCERLGISGAVTRDNFFSLCENRHPLTGEQLTSHQRKERTCGWDISFHVPKSASLIMALSPDDTHLIEAFNKSVDDTMALIEQDTKTRVRKGGINEDRETGNLAFAKFIHKTARPVDDKHLPDPHLHAHVYVFNNTYDEIEKKFKAAKVRDIFRDSGYYTALFQKSFADRLVDLGYRIKRTEKAFEIEGVPDAIIRHFSSRTNHIGQVAKEKGIVNAKEKDGLGAKTRGRKQKGLTMSELKSKWKEAIKRLTAALTIDDSTPIRSRNPRRSAKRNNSTLYVDYALSHSFERASVVSEKKLIEAALRNAVGDVGTTCSDVIADVQRDKRVLRITQAGRRMVTTKQILLEERRMVELATEGLNKISPLYRTAPVIKLDGQQKAAIEHILTTSNRTSLIRGAAGAGKTTLMSEALELIIQAGKQVTVVAPTANASRGVLKDEGFANAETVAKLLQDKNLQDKLEGQVIWCDEGGLLDTQSMTGLLELAKRKNAQLIIGGDTKQHSSVTRGDAMRILNVIGKIETAEVSRIHRQRNFQYKDVVESLSKGHIKDGFSKLDKMGNIITVESGSSDDKLVGDYVSALKRKKSALVISPTNNQADKLTEVIRNKLRDKGMIGKKEKIVTKLSSLNLTKAEKGDWQNYQPGQMIQFNQNVKELRRGSVLRVEKVEKRSVFISDEKGTKFVLPQGRADCFDVFVKSDMAVSKGDSVRITRNGFDRNKRRMNNGLSLEVIGISKKGYLKLRNKNGKAIYEVPHNYGHLSHSHVLTSYNSQGKTVDEVFISQPAATFPATDAKQFYVSVSRGRDAAKIYTDDKEGLLDYASELGERQSALELIQIKKKELDFVVTKQRQGYSKDVSMRNSRGNQFIQEREKDYEP
jgi:conjugative relaxase-like TrwC/TraI family protein